jgi:hypothetical protein
MIRGDNIICGTTTTGTGTLTLAATPVPPGGIDFDVFARATGIGFTNSAVILVSYTIIEYTDATFATAKATEKGIGTLTLGASAGIANATLARTTKQSSATSLDASPATQNIAPATGISIATAANTLVIIGASAADLLAFSPYFENTTGDQNGTVPLQCPYNGSGNIVGFGGSFDILTAVDYYAPFIWVTPMLVKRVTLHPSVAYSGGAPVSNAYARIYQINSSGRPGKLLYDFGLLGSANTSLNSTGLAASGAAGNGYFLMPGEYFFNFTCVLSGGVTAPRLYSGALVSSGKLSGGSNLVNGIAPLGQATATGSSGATAADPANITGYTITSQTPSNFALKSS